MLKKFVTLAAGAVTAAVAACGDAPRVTTPYMDPTGTWQEMVAAASRGPILAEVLNNPFDAPTEAVVEATLGHMRQAVTAYRGLDFTTDPGNAGHPDFRVVVAFNPPKGVSARSLCAGDRPAVERFDRLHVVAVFCEARRGVLADVRGSVGGKDLGPGDRGFRTLMSQVAIAMFREDPK